MQQFTITHVPLQVVLKPLLVESPAPETDGQRPEGVSHGMTLGRAGTAAKTLSSSNSILASCKPSSLKQVKIMVKCNAFFSLSPFSHFSRTAASSCAISQLSSNRQFQLKASSAVARVWQHIAVKSPHLAEAVSVVAIKEVPYITNGNRLQNLNIYLPWMPKTAELVDTALKELPTLQTPGRLPRWHVHVHGGAWRDPQLSATSIEAAVAHAFHKGLDGTEWSGPIDAIVSMNYTLSPFPTHPTLPYDPKSSDPRDPAREAQHPTHVQDVLHRYALLRSLGLTDRSYILSGHSCGACIAFQSALQPTRHWGVIDLPEIPQPAALLGMNGLYDLPNLVYGLGDSHAHLKEVYADLQTIAFGADECTWPAASPARVDADELAKRLQDGRAPPLVVVDQSSQDQLVPMNQVEQMKQQLDKIQGLRVVRGNRCVGEHAAPWKEGYIIWDSVKGILKLLADGA